MTENTGRSGYLRLVFGSGSRTTLAQQFARPPFHVQRAVYSDESLPKMAYVYMMSTSGGILGGDSHRIHITMKKDSMAHVTTQGANRIYKTRQEGASQTTHITLEAESYLEFMPDQTIPYGGSRFAQTTSITAHPTATLVYVDVLASGRLARGESFQYDMYQTRTTAQDPAGHLLFWDAARVEPGRRDPARYGVMGGHTITGTVYILAPQSGSLYHIINQMVSKQGNISGGASAMLNDAGILVRLLGADARPVLDMARSVADAVRRETWGAPLPEDRRC